MDNNDILKKIVTEKVIPQLEDFIKADEAFFIYVEFDGGKTGLTATITPAPGLDDIEEVMEDVAKEVYSHTQELPYYIVACEKIRYIEHSSLDDEEKELGEVKISELDRGVIIVAIKAEIAEGLMFLYSLPDMELIRERPMGDENDGAPPYTMLAISSYMYETLVQAGLIEPDEEVDGEVRGSTDVKFKFSNN